MNEHLSEQELEKIVQDYKRAIRESALDNSNAVELVTIVPAPAPQPFAWLWLGFAIGIILLISARIKGFGN